MNYLCKSLPSDSASSILLEETSAETLLVVRQKSINCEIFFSGDAANKKKVHCVIKCMSFYHLSDENLIICEFDSDGGAGTDETTAVAIDSSLKRIDPNTTNAEKSPSSWPVY